MAALSPGWAKALAGIRNTKEFGHLTIELSRRAMLGEAILPSKNEIFRAFTDLDFDDVRVVMVGDDPNSTPGVSFGRAYAVRAGRRITPELKRMFHELTFDIDDLDYTPTGQLDGWVREGVMLLNLTLTTAMRRPQSHRTIGWDFLTTRALYRLSERAAPVVFVLWGVRARDLRLRLAPSGVHHHYLELPSPAEPNFLGSCPFSKINEALKAIGTAPINWLDPDDHRHNGVLIPEIEIGADDLWNDVERDIFE